MKLESLRLQNIRAFEDSGDIAFGNGTISISGENGAGKSTIVNCLGRTVFGWDVEGVKSATIDYRGVTHKHGTTDYLLRKGANGGSIDVTFSHVGHTYRVRNALSRTSQTWELYIDGVNTKLYGKDEIHERIREALNVSESYGNSLGSLFSDVICVPQGHIVHEFEFSPQKRKDHFDKVLGLYTYRHAFEDSKHVKNNFKEKITKAGLDVKVLETEIENLTALVAKLTRDEAELAHLSTLIDEAEVHLETLSVQKKELEELYTSIDNLNNAVRLIESRIGGATELLHAARQEVERCRNAQDLVKKCRPLFERYTEVSRELERVRSLVREVATEREHVFELQKSLDALERAKRTKLEKLDRFDSECERLTFLAPDFDKYLASEARLELLNADQRVYESALERTHTNQRVLDSKMTRVSQLRAELEGYDALLSDAERVESLQLSYDTLSKKIGELTGHKQRIEQDAAQLSTGVCPYTHDQCDSLEALSHQHEVELTVLAEELAHLELDRTDVSEALIRAKESRRTLQLLEGPRRELELLNDEIVELGSNISEDRQFVDTVGDKSGEIAEVTTSLELLKPQAEEYRLLKFGVDRIDRAVLVQELDELDRQKASEQQRIDAVESKIATLVDHDGEDSITVKLEEELKGLQPAYDRYVASLSVAEGFSAAVQQCQTYVLSLEGLANERDGLSETLKAKESLYNRDEHLRVENEYDITYRHLNQTRGRASQLQQQIEAGRGYEKALTLKREDLMGIEVELNELSEDSAFFDEIRESFKKLSTMRPLYTRKISQHAAKHWRQMVEDGSELHWQEDYLIFKTIGDNVISLYEMSGGEKVSASLAVRLALQEVMGGLGLFILDEPTIHLDEERCDSLARQIGAITGLNQVLVISHDDTFHAYTKQQINIRKGENGSGSTVEW